MTRRRWHRKACWALLAACCGFALKTWCDIIPIPAGALAATSPGERYQVLDRNGIPLAVSYQNPLNQSDVLPLHEVPQALQDAFIVAEDKRFYSHHGVDWQARAMALWQNLVAMHGVRGASTISEQVVRILHPRPRTLWSRWIEGFEAASLERGNNKSQILEFYLNQVPYAAQRRGVMQAARYYFDRDVTTLTRKEMLALAVLPRAPSAYDLYKHPERIAPAIQRLATALGLTADELSAINTASFSLQAPELNVNATHFVQYVREQGTQAQGKLLTTLDSALQKNAEKLLAHQLKALQKKQVHNAALLVADHTTGEILSWVVAGDKASAIDAVRTPRQPGSSMKPFLYAQALDSGWSAATIIRDEPVTEEINSGLHHFNNYSHVFYGDVTLREALGNSLNIPALQTIKFVGVENYLATLHRLGFASLTQTADFYNEGLALGDGEVTLLELVQGYAALANHGIFRPFTTLLQHGTDRGNTTVYSDEAASLIGNILSDPWARHLEFGAGSILNMPVQTAAKTGTSTDYHDAWAVGYDAHYVVGVWMGNLDAMPMDGITGSTGPAYVLRSVFADLNKRTNPSALYLSPRLVMRDVCREEHTAMNSSCYQRTEYFLPGTDEINQKATPPASKPALIRPANGLILAYDPRIPEEKQAFEFVAQGIDSNERAIWLLNGRQVATTQGGHYLWPLKRGHYDLTLKLAREGGDDEKPVDSVEFVVK